MAAALVCVIIYALIFTVYATVLLWRDFKRNNGILKFGDRVFINFLMITVTALVSLILGGVFDAILRASGGE